MGTATGTGIWQVKILVPVPVPVAVPMRNPRVYPYPCNTLGITWKVLGTLWRS
jgi:hypothetical protein